MVVEVAAGQCKLRLCSCRSRILSSESTTGEPHKSGKTLPVRSVCIGNLNDYHQYEQIEGGERVSYMSEAVVSYCGRKIL